MRFLTFAIALLVPLSVQAFVAFTNDKFTGIKAGEPFKLTWKGDGTPVTITLMNGPSADLSKVSTVASTSDFPITSFAGMDYNAHQASAIESSYVWTTPSDLKSGTYALQIKQSGYTNYSPQFNIAGDSSTQSTKPSSTATKASSTPAATSLVATSSATATSSSAHLAIAAAVQQPPYPAGPNNSSNSTGASSSTGTGVSLTDTTVPGAAGTPVATVYEGNGTLVSGTLANGTKVFQGAAAKIGGGASMVVGVAFLAGAFVGGFGLVL